MLTSDVCTYKLMENEFAKSWTPAIELYTILEGKKQHNKCEITVN